MTPKDMFEILVREHAETLTLFLRSMVRDPALVDDLFQETMLVAWKNLDRFDRGRPFGPWLRGIARKLVLAHRRRGARGIVICEAEVLERLDNQFEAFGRQAGDTLDEKLEGLRACLEALPEPYREAVRLRYQEGYRGGHLADRLEITLENVKKRLQRGRGKLLECLRRKLALRGVTT